MKQPKPAIGMVCTRQQYSDRDVFLITAISESGKTLTVQKAKEGKKGKWAVLPEGLVLRLRKSEDGYWRALREDGKNSLPYYFDIGVAEPYYDRSF